METNTGSRRYVSLARKFAARLVAKTGKRTRAGLPAAFDRASPGGGGLAIEMWRAEDDGTAVAERKLQVAVFDQFARDALLDATDVKVDVRLRTVRLSGTVRTYAEKLEAERAARRVMGVKRVESELLVVRSIAA